MLTIHQMTVKVIASWAILPAHLLIFSGKSWFVCSYSLPFLHHNCDYRAGQGNRARLFTQLQGSKRGESDYFRFLNIGHHVALQTAAPAQLWGCKGTEMGGCAREWNRHCLLHYDFRQSGRFYASDFKGYDIQFVLILGYLRLLENLNLNIQNLQELLVSR